MDQKGLTSIILILGVVVVSLFIIGGALYLKNTHPYFLNKVVSNKSNSPQASTTSTNIVPTVQNFQNLTQVQESIRPAQSLADSFQPSPTVKQEASSADFREAGKFCDLITDRGIHIQYYGSGNWYHIKDFVEPRNSTQAPINHTLFNGKYYFWSEATDSSKLAATVYTAEEAHEFSFDDSFQLIEVQSKPQKCVSWKVEPQKFEPPKEIHFITIQEQTEEFRKAAEETIKRVCLVCLQEYTNRKDQLGCFSITNIFAQLPKGTVEATFDKYCLK